MQRSRRPHRTCPSPQVLLIRCWGVRSREMGPPCSTGMGTEAALCAAKPPTRLQQTLPNKLTQRFTAQELSKAERPVQGEQLGEMAARRMKWVCGRAVSGTQERVSHSSAGMELDVMLGRGLSTDLLSCSEISLCHCRLRTTLLPKSQHQGRRQRHLTMQGDGQTCSSSDSCPTEPPSPPATSLTGDPPVTHHLSGTHALDGQTDGIYASGKTNMMYGEQVVNKGILLVEEKDPDP